MKANDIRMLVAGLSMLVAAGFAYTLKPTTRIADAAPAVNLEQMIPRSFTDWKIDPSIVPISVSPEVQARLDKIYNQTLSRTYVNSRGERIMLSIVYGGDQSGDASQVHRPEYCYTAQGFQLMNSLAGRLTTEYGEIPVRRLFAVQGNRREPITYWITVGEKATLPGFGRKFAQLAYGLSGKIPDGMLVRVSSIDANERAAYKLQDTFIEQLLAAVPESHRTRIAGSFGA